MKTLNVKPVDPSAAVPSLYKKAMSDCVVLTKDGRILLQLRTPEWSHEGNLVLFGGHVEQGETAEAAVIRELKEEIGAIIDKADLVSLGAVTEDLANHTEIVFGHFWHDKHGTITGAYECAPVHYDNVAAALAYPKIMDYAVWFLEESRKQGLVS